MVEMWAKQLAHSATTAYTPAYAYSCFRIGALPHACLATTFAGYGANCYGRAGALTHVLLVPVDPRTDKGLLYTQALVEQSLCLHAGADMPIPEYLQQNTQSNTIEIEPPSLARIKDIDGSLLGELLKAAYISREKGISGDSGCNYSLPVASVHTLLRLLALAGVILPPRLQLAFYWGYGSGQTMRRQANFTIGPPPIQDVRNLIGEALSGYVERILNCVAVGHNSNLQDVWDGWDFRCWEELFAYAL